MTELKLDQDTVVPALLHDTVEDTLATIDEVDRLFGADVARLVDGVTKLSKIETLTENERAAEDLRKFLLADDRAQARPGHGGPRAAPRHRRGHPGDDRRGRPPVRRRRGAAGRWGD